MLQGVDEYGPNINQSSSESYNRRWQITRQTDAHSEFRISL